MLTAISTVTGNEVEIVKSTTRKVTVRSLSSGGIWTVARSYFKIAYIHPLWS